MAQNSWETFVTDPEIWAYLNAVYSLNSVVSQLLPQKQASIKPNISPVTRLCDQARVVYCCEEAVLLGQKGIGHIVQKSESSGT